MSRTINESSKDPFTNPLWRRFTAVALSGGIRERLAERQSCHRSPGPAIIERADGGNITHWSSRHGIWSVGPTSSCSALGRSPPQNLVHRVRAGPPVASRSETKFRCALTGLAHDFDRSPVRFVSTRGMKVPGPCRTFARHRRVLLATPCKLCRVG